MGDCSHCICRQKALWNKEGQPEDFVMSDLFKWHDTTCFWQRSLFGNLVFEWFFNRWPKNILVVKERLVHLWVAFCGFRVCACKVKAHLSISTSVNFMQLLTKGCSSSECANRAMYKCSSLQNDFCLLCSPAVPQTDSSSTIAICRSVTFFQVASSHVFLSPKPFRDCWE